MFPERRRSPRIEILGRISGHVASADAAVTVREMSLGGMSLETPLAFEEGSIQEFRLTLGDGSTTLLRGRVVRCRSHVSPDGVTTFVSGVQFVEDDSSVGGLIDKIK